MAKSTAAKAQDIRLRAIIVGVARSGTTLLASILNRHGEICVTPETHYFRIVNDAIPGGFTAICEHWPDSINKILNHIYATENWQPEAQDILNRTGTEAPTMDGLFTAIGDSIADSNGKKFWIEKTPPHIRYYKIIRRLFPNMPILHIVRDGRDAALSMSKTTWGSDSVCESMFRWKIEIEKFARESHGDPLVKTIQYEKLVQGTESIVRDICNFLDLEFQPSMLEPNGSEHTLIERGTKHKALIREKPDVSRTFDWKNTMGAELSRACETIGRETLENNGYQTNSPATHGMSIAVNTRPPYRDYPQALDKVLGELSETHTIVPLADARFCRLSFQRYDYIFWDGLQELEQSETTFADIFLNLAATTLASLWVRTTRSKLIWFYHGNISWSQKWQYRVKMESLVAKAADYVVCDNQDPVTVAEHLSIPASKVIHSVTSILDR